MSDWIYDPNINPCDYEGFVYLITNLVTGRKYVGRKYIWHKSKSRRVKESTWQRYWSSSDLVKQDVALLGTSQFRREVLHWCRTRQETNYRELEEQVLRQVLTARTATGQREYYNGNIMLRFYAPRDPLAVKKPRKAKAKAKSGTSTRL